MSTFNHSNIIDNALLIRLIHKRCDELKQLSVEINRLINKSMTNKNNELSESVGE